MFGRQTHLWPVISECKFAAILFVEASQARMLCLHQMVKKTTLMPHFLSLLPLLSFPAIRNDYGLCETYADSGVNKLNLIC